MDIGSQIFENNLYIFAPNSSLKKLKGRKFASERAKKCLVKNGFKKKQVWDIKNLFLKVAHNAKPQSQKIIIRH